MCLLFSLCTHSPTPLIWVFLILSQLGPVYYLSPWHSHLWSVILVSLIDSLIYSPIYYLLLIVLSLFSLIFSALSCFTIFVILSSYLKSCSQQVLSKCRIVPKLCSFQTLLRMSLFSQNFSQNVSMSDFSHFVNFLNFSQLSRFFSISLIVSKILTLSQVFSSRLLGLRNKGFSISLSQYVSPIFSNFCIFSVVLSFVFVACFFLNCSQFLVSLSFLRLSLFRIENSHLLNINLSFPRVWKFLKFKFILSNLSMVSKEFTNNIVWISGRLLPWRLQLPHCKGPNH